MKLYQGAIDAAYYIILFSSRILAHNSVCNRQAINTGLDLLQTDIILTGTGYPQPHALRAGGYKGEIIVGRDLSRVTLPLNGNPGNVIRDLQLALRYKVCPA